MVLADIDQALMARILGISPPTLRKAYRRELDTSYAIIKSEVVAKAVTLARAGDQKMVQFFLMCHGWAPSERVVVADGGIDDAASMSDAAIEARLAQLRRKAVVTRGARKGTA